MSSENEAFRGTVPSEHRQARRPYGSRDYVDEASWESFPASDPPGRRIDAPTSTGVRRRPQSASLMARRARMHVQRELQERPWPTLVAIAGLGVAAGFVSRPRQVLRVGRVLGRAARSRALRAGVVSMGQALKPRIERALKAASSAREESRMETRQEHMALPREGSQATTGSVRESATELVGEARETAERAASAISRRAQEASQSLQRGELGARGREVTQWIREHPALSLGLGVGCGVLIGRALAR